MKELYDRDMREALFSYFEDSFSKIRFLEEFTMGKSRADAVMITDEELVGFELKSDKDSLVRLHRQILDYDKYYDRNYVVVGRHFASKISEAVPEHWGIIEVYDAGNSKEDDEYNERSAKKTEIVVKEIRTATSHNKNNLNRQLEFLWREELIRVVRAYKLGGVSGKNKVKLRKMLREGIEKDKLKLEFQHQMMEREYPVEYGYLYNTPLGEMTFITNGYEIMQIVFGNVVAKFSHNDMSSLHQDIKKQMDEYFAGKRKVFELPLEKKRFNAFTRKVYESLTYIPYGETRTYAEIADMAGRPKSYRAVGTINNHNPYPIIVPCHRVIGSKGQLTGYAGGVELKEFLLELEKSNCK